jgi:DNA-binding MarR family transcriptional regulator
MQANVKRADDRGAVGGGGARGADGDLLTPLELGAWRGLLTAHAGLVRRLDADLRARHGISLTSYEVLMLLGSSDRRRMRISELSGATLLSVSGMSRMVDRLAREGLVVRESCEDDGRGAEVSLTPSGRGRLRAARASHLAGVRREFLERFSGEELAAMAGFWSRVEAGG